MPQIYIAALATGCLHSGWQVSEAFQAAAPLQMAWLGGQNSRIFFALRVESSTRKFCGQGVKRGHFSHRDFLGIRPEKGCKTGKE